LASLGKLYELALRGSTLIRRCPLLRECTAI